MKKIISLLIIFCLLISNVGFAIDLQSTDMPKQGITLSPSLVFDDLGKDTQQHKFLGLAQIGLQMDLQELDKLTDIDNAVSLSVILETFQKNKRLKQEQTYQIYKEEIGNKPAQITSYFNELEQLGKHIFSVPVSVEKDESREDLLLIFSTIRDDKGGFPIVFCTKEELEQLKVTIQKRDILPIRQATSATLPIKRIGILTGGGTASGHNAIIYSAFIEAKKRGAQLIGIFGGFNGLVDEKLVKKARPLTLEELDRAKDLGGTVIETGRLNPYSEKNIQSGVPDIVWENMKKLKLDALIVAGGDDTNSAGGQLSKEHNNFPVIGVSKTMDNDLALPDNAPTYGYHTWVTQATDQAKMIEENARANNCIMVVETFGRHAGFAPLGVGMSIGAARTLLPEVEVDLEELIKDVRTYYDKFGYAVIIVSEGMSIDLSSGKNKEILDKALENDAVANAFFTSVKEYDDFGHPKLKGAGTIITAILKANIPYKVTETERLNYAPRTASTTFSDLERCMLEGTVAVERLFNNSFGELLYFDQGKVRSISLQNELGGRGVDVEGDHKIHYMHANVAILLRDDPDIFSTEDKQDPENLLDEPLVAETIQKGQHSNPDSETLVNEESQNVLLQQAMETLPAMYASNGMNAETLLDQLSTLLGQQLSFNKNSTFIFSEKTTFDNGIGALLPKLAKAGMKIAVIATNDKQREIIDELNKDKPENEKIIYADSVVAVTTMFSAARYYYFKVSGDKEVEIKGVSTFDITHIVQKIIEALGRACGVVDELLPKLYDATQKFAQAA